MKNLVLKLSDGSDFETQELSKGRVILFSYPRAFTSGCTKEVCSIQDDFSMIMDHDVKLFGISTDPPEKNQKFAEKYQLRYPLISDVEHELLEELEMYGEKTLYGKKRMGVKRQILFIEDGEVVKRIKGVKTASAGQQILKALDALGW